MLLQNQCNPQDLHANSNSTITKHSKSNNYLTTISLFIFFFFWRSSVQKNWTQWLAGSFFTLAHWLICACALLLACLDAPPWLAELICCFFVMIWCFSSRKINVLFSEVLENIIDLFTSSAWRWIHSLRLPCSLWPFSPGRSEKRQVWIRLDNTRKGLFTPSARWSSDLRIEFLTHTQTDVELFRYTFRVYMYSPVVTKCPKIPKMSLAKLRTRCEQALKSAVHRIFLLQMFSMWYSRYLFLCFDREMWTIWPVSAGQTASWQYPIIEKWKNEIQFFSIKDIDLHCWPVLMSFVVIYGVTNFLPKLVDMLLFSMEKLNFHFLNSLFSGFAPPPSGWRWMVSLG